MKIYINLILIILLILSCKTGEKLTSPDHYIIKKSVKEKVRLGEAAEFKIEIIPTDGFEMEVDAPITLKFDKDSNLDIDFEKEIYTKDDLLNKDIKRPVFIGRFRTRKSGEHKIIGNLSFVVCTSSICEPKKTDVIFHITTE